MKPNIELDSMNSAKVEQEIYSMMKRTGLSRENVVAAKNILNAHPHLMKKTATMNFDLRTKILKILRDYYYDA